jgi:hypothetical protein
MKTKVGWFGASAYFQSQATPLSLLQQQLAAHHHDSVNEPPPSQAVRPRWALQKLSELHGAVGSVLTSDGLDLSSMMLDGCMVVPSIR